jgi:hypothetical protein
VSAFAIEPAVITDLQVFFTVDAGRGPVHLQLFIQFFAAEVANPHDMAILHVNPAEVQ